MQGKKDRYHEDDIDRILEMLAEGKQHLESQSDMQQLVLQQMQFRCDPIINKYKLYQTTVMDHSREDEMITFD